MTAELLNIFVPAFVTLFVVIDPVGMAPIFAIMTDGGGEKYRRRMAIRGSLFGALILIFFGLFGRPFLDALGISMDAFRIAGGFMLFVVAFEMVFEKRVERREKAANRMAEEQAQDEDISVFPVAIPMLAGPGAITSVLLLISGVEGDYAGQGAVYAAILAVFAITLVLFIAAGAIVRLMGKTASALISRVLGVVVAALATQYMLDGLAGVLG